MTAEYGYISGDFLPSPGFLKVEVANASATISYIKMQSNGGDSYTAGTAFTYEVYPRTAPAC